MDCKALNFILPSGNKMPCIGFGTYRIQGTDLIKQVLDFALNAGYRHIDTAAVYNNERDIGAALKQLLPKYNLTRKDIFITSKLSPSDHGERALSALKKSISNLQCDYLDLYLIHWPGAGGIINTSTQNANLRSLSWQQLVKGRADNLVKDIGVSNYTIKHLTELLSNDFGVKPAVNQVEWHPYYSKRELKEFCENENIVLQAYSSLGGSYNTTLLEDKLIIDTANKLRKTPSQVLLRWALQQNIGIIPKARSAKHIEENIALNFEIPEEDMEKLSNMNKEEKFAWNPDTIF